MLTMKDVVYLCGRHVMSKQEFWNDLRSVPLSDRDCNNCLYYTRNTTQSWLNCIYCVQDAKDSKKPVGASSGSYWKPK